MSMELAAGFNIGRPDENYWRLVREGSSELWGYVFAGRIEQASGGRDITQLMVVEPWVGNGSSALAGDVLAGVITNLVKAFFGGEALTASLELSGGERRPGTQLGYSNSWQLPVDDLFHPDGINRLAPVVRKALQAMLAMRDDITTTDAPAGVKWGVKPQSVRLVSQVVLPPEPVHHPDNTQPVPEPPGLRMQLIYLKESQIVTTT